MKDIKGEEQYTFRLLSVEVSVQSVQCLSEQTEHLQ